MWCLKEGQVPLRIWVSVLLPVILLESDKFTGVVSASLRKRLFPTAALCSIYFPSHLNSKIQICPVPLSALRFFSFNGFPSSFLPFLFAFPICLSHLYSLLIASTLSFIPILFCFQCFTLGLSSSAVISDPPPFLQLSLFPNLWSSP